MSKVMLQSEEGELLEVDLETAKSIRTIQAKLDDIIMQGGKVEEAVIPLPKVSSFILKKVIVWANHYKDGVPEPSEEDQETGAVGGIDSWASNFLNLEPTILCQLMLAANYLGVRNLTDATAKGFSNMMTRTSPADGSLINQMFAFGLH